MEEAGRIENETFQIPDRNIASKIQLNSHGLCIVTSLYNVINTGGETGLTELFCCVAPISRRPSLTLQYNSLLKMYY